MSIRSSPALTTAEQLFDQADDGYRYDLFQGMLEIMSPAGGRHGRVAFRLAYLLNQHVEAGQLGVVFAAETGFLLARNPDTVLAPDVAFISRRRYQGIEDETRFIAIIPELTIEVLSPNDRLSRVEAKAFAWLDAGAKLVLIVDPAQETVRAYRSRDGIQIFEADEIVECSDAVAGWQLCVREVFRSPY